MKKKTKERYKKKNRKQILKIWKRRKRKNEKENIVKKMNQE